MDERKDYITLLGVVSAIAVVYLHANGCFWDFSTDDYRFSANIIESVFFFGVSEFFMITGVTLIDYPKRYSTEDFFRRRFQVFGHSGHRFE